MAPCCRVALQYFVDHELCIRETNKSTESVDNSVHNYHPEQDRRVKLANRHNLEQTKICMNSQIQIWHFLRRLFMSLGHDLGALFAAGADSRAAESVQ